MNSVVSAMTLAFAEKRIETLAKFFVNDVVLRPPTYGGSWQGNDLVTKLLEHAAACFEEFRYTDVVAEGELVVLRFDTKVDGKSMTGVDLVRLNDQHQIVEIEIFSRPPKVAERLLELMTERIAGDPETAAMMRSLK